MYDANASHICLLKAKATSYYYCGKQFVPNLDMMSILGWSTRERGKWRKDPCEKSIVVILRSLIKVQPALLQCEVSICLFKLHSQCPAHLLAWSICSLTCGILLAWTLTAPNQPQFLTLHIAISNTGPHISTVFLPRPIVLLIHIQQSDS